MDWWIGQFGVVCLGPRCLGVMCDLVGKRCNEFLVSAGLNSFDLQWEFFFEMFETCIYDDFDDEEHDHNSQ